MKVSSHKHRRTIKSGSFRMFMLALFFSWLCAMILLHAMASFDGVFSHIGQDGISSQAASLASSFRYASNSSTEISRKVMQSPSVSMSPTMTETPLKMDSSTTSRADIVSSIKSTTRSNTTHLQTINLFHVDPFFKQQHENIDSKPVEARCAAFGVAPLSHGVPPRKLFFGSMLADENMDVLKIHALEAYNIYHAVVFVESNTSHSGAPRTMRFRGTLEERLLRESNLFGEDTTVLLDYWMEAMPDLTGMDREVEQRVPIMELWKQAGMTERDVAVMADVDEILSRDFLRALQVCDFPALRQEESPSCQEPKMSLNTLVFEASPHCISKRGWFHPDVILGQCIDGIGDPTERILPKRNFKRKYGSRTSEYGLYDPNQYPQHVLDSGHFPLWSSRDIREVAGSANGLTEYTNTDTSNVLLASVAYHLHNWFDDLSVLRNKYSTYGHFDKDWANAPNKILSKINREIDLVVRCARDLGNEFGEDKYYERDELKDNRYNRPIFFLNETYSRERHSLIQELVRMDEKIFGSGYAQDGSEINPQEQQELSEQKKEKPNPSKQHSDIGSKSQHSDITFSGPPHISKQSDLMPRPKLAPQSFKVR